MMWVEIVAGAAVAWVVTRRTAMHVAASAPLSARNYRGLEVPTAVGIAVVIGVMAGLGVVSFIARLDRGLAVAGNGLLAAALVLGFGLLGLWDDLAAAPTQRGWRAHLGAIARGTPTTGAIKLVGGGVLAFIVTAPFSRDIPSALLHAAVIALSANLINLLDLRPGRAGKFFVLFVGPIIVLGLVWGSAVTPALAVAAAAVVGFLPWDLRERAMLGDVGANAIGAILGLGLSTSASDRVHLLLLVALIAIHVAADRPGLSRLIRAAKPVQAFDALGRVPE